MKFEYAQFGPKSPFSGIAVMAVPELADSELTNAQELSGAVAAVKRGGCQFHEKARRVQQAVAIAVIVVNTEDKTRMMGGGENNEGRDITIPVISVASSIGAELVSGAEVHLVKGAAIKALAEAIAVSTSLNSVK